MQGFLLRWVQAVSLAMVCTTAANADERQREPIATTEFFAFYSDFPTNLNDALINTGVDRKFNREELFKTGAEQACFERLPPSVRTGWDLAVEYYTKVISSADWDASQQYLIRLQLANIPWRQDPAAQRFLDLAESFRSAAAPAYEACRWSAQDEANRRWIAEVVALLGRYESRIGQALSRLYQTPWPKRRLDYDVVQTVSWSGANSAFPPGVSGHILISAESGEYEALETVFHEASHGFMLSDAPLWVALEEGAERLGVAVPQGLWHVVLFHTTGDSITRVLEADGKPGYRPMIYEIYERSAWRDYREAMEAVWPSYLAGDRNANEAVIELLKTLTAESGD